MAGGVRGDGGSSGQEVTRGASAPWELIRWARLLPVGAREDDARTQRDGQTEPHRPHEQPELKEPQPEHPKGDQSPRGDPSARQPSGAGTDATAPGGEPGATGAEPPDDSGRRAIF